ncbi:hypothetical protein LXL04_037165 [Taraxacum kok-saghyz]
MHFTKQLVEEGELDKAMAGYEHLKKKGPILYGFTKELKLKEARNWEIELEMEDGRMENYIHTILGMIVLRGDTPSGNLLTIREVSQVPAFQVSGTAGINVKGPGNLGRIKWRHPWDPEQIVIVSPVSIPILERSPQIRLYARQHMISQGLKKLFLLKYPPSSMQRKSGASSQNYPASATRFKE